MPDIHLYPFPFHRGQHFHQRHFKVRIKVFRPVIAKHPLKGFFQVEGYEGFGHQVLYPVITGLAGMTGLAARATLSGCATGNSLLTLAARDVQLGEADIAIGVGLVVLRHAIGHEGAVIAGIAHAIAIDVGIV